MASGKRKILILVEAQETLPAQKQVLNAQLGLLNQFEKAAVLSTCPFFIPEYNPALIL